MGIEHVLISARSPWQNPYVERVIGSIRRECLDHTIVINEAAPMIGGSPEIAHNTRHRADRLETHARIW